MSNLSKVGGRVSAEHTNHCPYSVFLADVVRAGAERLLTANGKATSIHQVTEEFPT